MTWELGRATTPPSWRMRQWCEAAARDQYVQGRRGHAGKRIVADEGLADCKRGLPASMACKSRWRGRDDIELYKDDSRKRASGERPFTSCANKSATSPVNQGLAEFIAPCAAFCADTPCSQGPIACARAPLPHYAAVASSRCRSPAPASPGLRKSSAEFAVSVGADHRRCSGKGGRRRLSLHSCCARWPTVWPRLLPRRLHERVRKRVLGVRHREECSRPHADLIAEAYRRHSSGAGLSGLPGPLARRQRLFSICSRRRHVAQAFNLTEGFAMLARGIRPWPAFISRTRRRIPIFRRRPHRHRSTRRLRQAQGNDARGSRPLAQLLPPGLTAEHFSGAKDALHWQI